MRIVGKRCLGWPSRRSSADVRHLEDGRGNSREKKGMKERKRKGYCCTTWPYVRVLLCHVAILVIKVSFFMIKVSFLVSIVSIIVINVSFFVMKASFFLPFFTHFPTR